MNYIIQLVFITGCNLRGDVKYPIANDRKVHPTRVLSMTNRFALELYQ